MAAPDSLSALAVARRIAARLDEDGLPYGIGGALALGAWGAVRATKDVDMTIFAREDELARVFDVLERAGIMIDRTGAARDVSRIGMFKGQAGRIIYVRGWLTKMVPAGDRRLALLDDLERRAAQR
jgi:hypothetical protein